MGPEQQDKWSYADQVLQDQVWGEASDAISTVRSWCDSRIEMARSWDRDRERLLQDIAKLEAEMGRLEDKYNKVCSLNRDFQSNVEKATRTPGIYVGGH